MKIDEIYSDINEPQLIKKAKKLLYKQYPHFIITKTVETKRHIIFHSRNCQIMYMKDDLE